MSGADTVYALMRCRKRLSRSLAGFFVIIALAVFSAGLGCAVEPMSKPAIAETLTDKTGVVEKLGIKPLGVLLTVAGTMLEFRYIVADSEKSQPVFDRRIKTYLVDQASGSGFDVPSDTKLGPLRSSSRNPVAGKEYFIMFVNPGRQVKRGNKVTIFIGDYKIENLTVE